MPLGSLILLCGSEMKSIVNHLVQKYNVRWISMLPPGIPYGQNQRTGPSWRVCNFYCQQLGCSGVLAL